MTRLVLLASVPLFVHSLTLLASVSCPASVQPALASDASLLNSLVTPCQNAGNNQTALCESCLPAIVSMFSSAAGAEVGTPSFDQVFACMSIPTVLMAVSGAASLTLDQLINTTLCLGPSGGGNPSGGPDVALEGLMMMGLALTSGSTNGLNASGPLSTQYVLVLLTAIVLRWNQY